jgi:hypothetical protein
VHFLSDNLTVLICVRSVELGQITVELHLQKLKLRQNVLEHQEIWVELHVKRVELRIKRVELRIKRVELHVNMVETQVKSVEFDTNLMELQLKRVELQPKDVELQHKNPIFKLISKSYGFQGKNVIELPAIMAVFVPNLKPIQRMMKRILLRQRKPDFESGFEVGVGE